MTKEEIETILRVELMGEMKGIGQVMGLMQDCVVHCKTENKNYVDGDKLMGLVRERKKLLIDRFERGRNL